MEYLKAKLFDPLWMALIRPKRDDYTDSDLGPEKFKYRGRLYRRRDNRIHRDGLRIELSLFKECKADRKPLAVVLHGNSSSRVAVFRSIKHLFASGFDVLGFDFTGSGRSEGEFITLGLKEKEDLHAVLAYVRRETRYEEVVLWGRSMGAVTALLYIADPKSYRIQAVVADSPFADLEQVACALADKNPLIPSILASNIL
jgi:alpha-beta hydrolase superfamily lysophospholipase